MAEEFKERPLEEIPKRVVENDLDKEKELIALVNSIKESLDTKILALRKDLDRKSQEQITNEILKVQEVVEKVRSEGEDVRLILSAKVANLEDKVDARESASSEEMTRFMQDVETKLHHVQDITAKLDPVLFMNEIRGLFADKLAQAEEKIKAFTTQLAEAQEEVGRLKKALGEKDLQASQENELFKRVLASKDAEIHRLQQFSSPAPSRMDVHQEGNTAQFMYLPSSSQPRASSPSIQKRASQDEEVPYSGPGSNVGKKTSAYCMNCGKRMQKDARFCVFCGSDNQSY